ncbi:MAG: PVC-type heme-binding CxxCH protein [Bryobacteraceae bacterium]
MTLMIANRGTVVCLLMLCACGGSNRPLSPQDALKSFALSDDFRIELFAAEPDVVDPVEMVFDENGRIYVAEMIDYPDDPPKGKPARSRIRLLEDRDGDGRYEHSVIFAERVLQVSGLLVWKDGLLVTSAPEILFMKDSNGDGKADIRRVLYTGFPKVNPEARITNLRLGIDNWIYAANAGSDGRIVSPDHPERPPILVRGADFRFHLDRDLAEAASGPTQYGMTFDDWGNRFLTQNTVHLRHAVMPYQYLMRAPLLDVPAMSQDISDHGRPTVPIYPLTRPQAWREERTRLRQQRYDENKNDRIERLGGYFTAATGSMVYTGDVFPKEYWGNVFTGEVNGNLIHRDILKPEGVTFSASRAKEGVEFLASRDVWFRPANLANAPDGNLYVMDMYREFIETPESIPEEIKKNMNFWSGDTLGRIYRIVPKQPLRKRDLKPNLGKASTAELVSQLSNTNGWHRQTAQRLLVDRKDPAAAVLLAQLAGASDYPQARLHALWTLEGLSALQPDLVARALKDPHPAIREHAIRLAELFLPKLGANVLALASDPEPRVRFQSALTLGGWKDLRVLKTLADLAERHRTDDWFRLAILSSVSNSAAGMFQLLASRSDDPPYVRELAQLIGAEHNSGEVVRFLQTLARVKKPEDGLAGLTRGFRLGAAKALTAPGAEAALARFLNSASQPVQNAAWEAARFFELRELVQKAAGDARNTGLPLERRVFAIRALRGGRFPVSAPVLRQVLGSNPPAEIQTAAVEALAAFDDPAVSAVLLENWKSYTPDARRQAMNAMLNHEDRVPLLLEAIEGGAIEPGAIEVAARARLIEFPDSRIAERAKRLLHSQEGDRLRVVESYRDALQLRGDVESGKRAFEENCAKCHSTRPQGGRVGPDLSGINNKTKEELLTSILHPSYSVESRYVNYMITTKDGRMHDGIIVNETPGVITLRGGSEEDEIVLRSSIAEIRASAISLMPEDLEKSLTRQDMADVIGYLRGGL